MKYEELVKRLRAMGYSFCDYAADAIEALAAENARLAASEPMCVAVKPLEWEHVTLTQTWQAKSIFGEYAVGFDDGWWAQLGGYANWEWNAPDDPRSYHGPDAAKAAAQTDYDARILSAITMHPETEVRAKTWAAAIEAAISAAESAPVPDVPDEYRQTMAICDAIRVLITDDASTALDRIKAEAKAEGMREAALIARAVFDDMPSIRRENHEYFDGFDNATRRAEAAILAAIPEGAK